MVVACEECVRLTREYNTHVANGLLIKARQSARMLDAHEATHRAAAFIPTVTWDDYYRSEHDASGR